MGAPRVTCIEKNHAGGASVWTHPQFDIGRWTRPLQNMAGHVFCHRPENVLYAPMPMKASQCLGCMANTARVCGMTNARRAMRHRARRREISAAALVFFLASSTPIALDALSVQDSVPSKRPDWGLPKQGIQACTAIHTRNAVRISASNNAPHQLPVQRISATPIFTTLVPRCSAVSLQTASFLSEQSHSCGANRQVHVLAQVLHHLLQTAQQLIGPERAVESCAIDF